MNNLISRDAAIDRIESHLRFGDELYPLTKTDKILNYAFEVAASCVYNLPAAQPERMNGRWISDEDGNIYCSVCGRTGVGESFCEHCGANMKGEEDDRT